jgi:hypothetical protein
LALTPQNIFLAKLDEIAMGDGGNVWRQEGFGRNSIGSVGRKVAMFASILAGGVRKKPSRKYAS